MCFGGTISPIYSSTTDRSAFKYRCIVLEQPYTQHSYVLWGHHSQIAVVESRTFLSFTHAIKFCFLADRLSTIWSTHRRKYCISCRRGASVAWKVSSYSHSGSPWLDYQWIPDVLYFRMIDWTSLIDRRSWIILSISYDIRNGSRADWYVRSASMSVFIFWRGRASFSLYSAASNSHLDEYRRHFITIHRLRLLTPLGSPTYHWLSFPIYCLFYRKLAVRITNLWPLEQSLLVSFGTSRFEWCR